MNWRAATTAGVFGIASMAVLGALAVGADAPFLFPSLGPTAFLIAYRPDVPASSPRNTMQGHAIGVACGYGALLLCGLADDPGALTAGMTPMRVLAASLALGGTSAGMALLDRPHPPAGATTLIVALGLLSTPRDLMILGAAVLALVGLGLGFSLLTRAPLPAWAPTAAAGDRAKDTVN